MILVLGIIFTLHYPQSHLSVYQKGAHYTKIKIFKRLPVPIKQLSHDTK
jgi:hypothetical protein